MYKRQSLTFREGSDTLRVGLKAYVDGVSTVKDGAGQLDSGAAELKDGAAAAVSGVNAVSYTHLNILAAILFPAFGALIGFDTHSGEAFGIFAGTAVNDTSSVTAAASTWDSLYNLGAATLDKARCV